MNSNRKWWAGGVPTAPVWYAMERTRDSHMSLGAQVAVAELEYGGLFRGHHKKGEGTLLMEAVTET